MNPVRYRFFKDDDGHNYLLPSHQWQSWHDLHAKYEGAAEDAPQLWEDPAWHEIEKHRIDGVNAYTFEKPLEDKF